MPHDIEGTSIHGKMTKKWYFFKGKPERPEGVAHLLIFGGSVYPELSQDVCKLLGIEEGKISLGRYSCVCCVLCVVCCVLCAVPPCPEGLRHRWGDWGQQ